MWMWGGASVEHTHALGARGPGFDPTPKHKIAFFRKTLSSPFFQTTDLKTIKLCDVML